MNPSLAFRRPTGRLFSVLISILLAAAAAHAQQTVTVSGNLQELTGSAISANVKVRFYLQNCAGVPRVLGTGVLAREFYELTPDAAGLFSGSLYPNSAIDCDGSTSSMYRMVVVSGNVPKWSADFLIDENTDINSAVPVATAPLPEPQSYLRTNFSGTQTVKGDLKVEELNGMVLVDQSSGGDFCEKLNSALLRSETGWVDATGVIGNQTCSVNPFTGVTHEVVNIRMPCAEIDSSVSWEFGVPGATVQRVHLRGCGHGSTSVDSGGTKLKFSGPGPILKANQVRAVSIERMSFDGKNGATTGVLLNGAYFSRLTDIAIGNIKCSDGTAAEPCAAASQNPAVEIDAAGSGGNYGVQNITLDNINSRYGTIMLVGDPTSAQRPMVSKLDSVNAANLLIIKGGTAEFVNTTWQPVSGPAVQIWDAISASFNQIDIEGSPSVNFKLAPELNTTVAAAVAPGMNQVAPASMLNADGSSIVAGDYLLIDNGTASGEIVKVTAADATTFTASFTKSHAAGFTVSRGKVNDFHVLGGQWGQGTLLSGRPNNEGFMSMTGAGVRMWAGSPGVQMFGDLNLYGANQGPVAATGNGLRLPYDFELKARNSANTGDLTVLRMNPGDNRLEVGVAGNGTVFPSNVVISGTTNMTGQARSADGSVAAPGWSFTLDTDTGIYRPASNTIAFAAGGAKKFEVSSAGSNALGSLTLDGSPVLTEASQNAGTDISADLEEESHAAEHNPGGPDPLNYHGDGAAIATVGGATTGGNCAQWDATGNLVDAGAACGGGGGGGDNITVNGTPATDASFSDGVASGDDVPVKFSLDTVPTPDSVTAKIVTTDIGSVAFGSGSAFTWTFDGGAGTDPALTFNAADAVFNQLWHVRRASSSQQIKLERTTSSAGVAFLGVDSTCGPDCLRFMDSAGANLMTLRNGGTLTSYGNILFNSDNTNDIGQLAASRPRSGYFGTSVVAPTVNVTSTLQTAGTQRLDSSGALTNVSFNAEATGNTLTTVSRMLAAAAGCDGANAAFGAFDLPPTNAPVPACYGTSPQRFGGLDFADGSALTASGRLLLPQDWTGGIDLTLVWFSGSAAAGNVVWTFQTACVSDSEDLLAPALNAAQTITDSNNATANTRNSVSLSGLTTTGCAPGDDLFLRVGRDPGNASDTLAATAVLLEVQVSLRRAQ